MTSDCGRVRERGTENDGGGTAVMRATELKSRTKGKGALKRTQDVTAVQGGKGHQEKDMTTGVMRERNNNREHET